MDRARGADVLVDRREQENDILSMSAWAAEQEAAARERRLLMQAAIDVMGEHPDRSPRVSDIVARAGLSNNAFYRHFRGKDDLVLAILDDGRRTLLGYLDHLMAAEATGRGQGPALDRGDDGASRRSRRRSRARAPCTSTPRVSTVVWATKVAAPKPTSARCWRRALRDAGAPIPARDAYVIFQAVVGSMTDFLVRQVKPSAEDIEHLASFCVAGISECSDGT